MNPDSSIQFNPPEKIPIWAKPFVGRTPAQFLEIYIPRKKVEALAGMMFAFADLGVTLPEWTQNASMQFWKNFIGNKPLRMTESTEDFGVFMVMLEWFIQNPRAFQSEAEPQSKLQNFLGGIAKRVYSLLKQKVVTNFSHAERAQFYMGCSRGEEILAKMRNPDHLAMVKLALLYLAVSVAWREIAEFETHAAREKWLRDGQAIKPNVSSREVYQAFQIINLPGAKPGKPKQIET